MQKSHLNPKIRALAVAALLLTGAGFSFPAVGDCQFCYRGGIETQPGQCLDILNPSPSVDSVSECVGILRCWPFLGGRFCLPDCAGYDCLWV